MRAFSLWPLRSPHFEPDDERWDQVCGKVTLAMVTLDPASLGRWLDPLRPLHHRLIAPLGAIFRDKALPESQRLLSTSILADFAGDDPEALAGLLMDADAKAFASLFPAVEIVKDKAVPIFQKVVDEPASVGRKRSPVDPSWTTPGPGVTRPIESADGIVKDQFAFCQTMPLREFGVVDEGLRNLGYRMARFRPFLDGKVVRAAAIWNRDGLSTRFERGQPAQAILAQDEKNRKDGFVPTDVSGYVSLDDQGHPSNRYSAIWVKAAGGAAEVVMHIGEPADKFAKIREKVVADGMAQRTFQVMFGCEGHELYSGIWGPAPSTGLTVLEEQDLFEADFAAIRERRGGLVVIDAAVNATGAPRKVLDRARAALERGDDSTKSLPDEHDVMRELALAYVRLDQPAKAEERLSKLVAEAPTISIRCTGGRRSAPPGAEGGCPR